VNGKCGKPCLNPVVMNYIKSTTFQFYPLQGSEVESCAWGACVVAIDESSSTFPPTVSELEKTTNQNDDLGHFL